MSSLQANENPNEVKRTMNVAISSQPIEVPLSLPAWWDEGDLIKHVDETGKITWVRYDDDQQINKLGLRSLALDPKANFWRMNIKSYKWGNEEDSFSWWWSQYIRWDKCDLDAEFDKYQLGDEDVKEIRNLIQTMNKGKIQPSNVVCIAGGTFHHTNPRAREYCFGQLAALIKFIEILGIPKDAKKVFQDPAVTPGDEAFLERLGFQVVTDPEGINAIDGETLLFYIRGYDFITERIMDRPRPAMFISDRSLEVRVDRNRDKPITQEEEELATTMSTLFESKKIPKIGKGEGMNIANLYWRRRASPDLGEQKEEEYVVGEVGEREPDWFVRLLNNRVYYSS